MPATRRDVLSRALERPWSEQRPSAVLPKIVLPDPQTNEAPFDKSAI
jgi:hypothetical protein